MSLKYHNIIIIGAGASGLMVANRYKDKDIAIIESNKKAAKKIEISGGGRCNITNKILSSKNYLGDRDFISKVLENFTQNDLLEWLFKRGLKPVIKNRYQYFCKKSSSEIIDALLKDLKGVKFYFNHKVSSVIKKGDHFIIDDKFRCKYLIVASGGLSYQKIGASDIAFKIAESFSHKINRPSPALVGFTLQKEQFWMKNLSGISLPVSIKIEEKEIRGDLLFAHKGISGPAILNASLYWQRGKICIDFMLDKRIEFKSSKLISNGLYLPKRFIKLFLKSHEIEDKPLNQLSKDEKERLKTLKNYIFAPAGDFGYTKAEVTKGGVATNEIDSKMMSKKCKNLFFIGECLDVTGELGGYNFQWAFSCAFALRL